jgi:hypothetical protein
MGYDALWRKNSTGLAVQHQALSFAGSTLNARKRLKMELSGSDSRNFVDPAGLRPYRLFPREGGIYKLKGDKLCHEPRHLKESLH